MRIDTDQRALRYLKSLVRVDLRKFIKGTETLKGKFAAAYDPAARDAKRAFIEEVYRMLGGDPQRISISGGR
jgi:hypothetical protein